MKRNAECSVASSSSEDKIESLDDIKQQVRKELDKMSQAANQFAQEPTKKMDEMICAEFPNFTKVLPQMYAKLPASNSWKRNLPEYVKAQNLQS